MPRCSFFCVWNSFNNVYYGISDNAHAYDLMNASQVVTREEVNWQYELPMSLGLTRMGTLLQVNWQGGVLQSSTNLTDWADLPGASKPHAHDPNSAPQGFWRVRK